MVRRDKVVLNTLVFLDAHQKGISQTEMLDWCKELGVQTVEVRREFFKTTDEMEATGRKAHALALRLFYSVPETMFADGVLKRDAITQYVKEAEMLGSRQVKMVIGDYEKMTAEDAAFLNQLCDRINGKLLIENDQTEENGKADKMVRFLEESAGLGGRIGATFDVGNFVWAGEQPLINAGKLAKYTEYIHLKDVTDLEQPQAAFLSEGVLDWKAVMENLPSDIPAALEYPCGEKAADQLIIEIEKLCKE